MPKTYIIIILAFNIIFFGKSHGDIFYWIRVVIDDFYYISKELYSPPWVSNSIAKKQSRPLAVLCDEINQPCTTRENFWKGFQKNFILLLSAKSTFIFILGKSHSIHLLISIRVFKLCIWFDCLNLQSFDLKMKIKSLSEICVILCQIGSASMDSQWPWLFFDTWI